MEQFMGWDDGAGYYVAARPTTPRQGVPDDFYSREGLSGALAKPPTLRWGGFGLSYEEEPERVGAQLVVASARERCLWLHPEGAFAAGMNAKGEFLSWGFTDNLEDPGLVHINPIVLVEFTLLFARFVWDNLVPRYGRAWEYFVEIRGARNRPWHLALALRRFPLTSREPTGDYMTQRLEGLDSPERDAYKLVASVYDFFGVEHAAIPFAQGDAIDPQQLIAESQDR
jgi:hypothetical protein